MTATITMSIALFIQSPIELDRATTYNAEVNQCDSDPLTTADGSRIDLDKLANGQLRWCALSRDLIWDEERQKLHGYDTSVFRGFFVSVIQLSLNQFQAHKSTENGWFMTV